MDHKLTNSPMGGAVMALLIVAPNTGGATAPLEPEWTTGQLYPSGNR